MPETDIKDARWPEVLYLRQIVLALVGDDWVKFSQCTCIAFTGHSIQVHTVPVARSSLFVMATKNIGFHEGQVIAQSWLCSGADISRSYNFTWNKLGGSSIFFALFLTFEAQTLYQDQPRDQRKVWSKGWRGYFQVVYLHC